MHLFALILPTVLLPIYCQGRTLQWKEQSSLSSRYDDRHTRDWREVIHDWSGTRLLKKRAIPKSANPTQHGMVNVLSHFRGPATNTLTSALAGTLEKAIAIDDTKNSILQAIFEPKLKRDAPFPRDLGCFRAGDQLWDHLREFVMLLVTFGSTVVDQIIQHASEHSYLANSILLNNDFVPQVSQYSPISSTWNPGEGPVVSDNEIWQTSFASAEPWGTMSKEVQVSDSANGLNYESTVHEIPVEEKTIDRYPSVVGSTGSVFEAVPSTTQENETVFFDSTNVNDRASSNEASEEGEFYWDVSEHASSRPILVAVPPAPPTLPPLSYEPPSSSIRVQRVHELSSQNTLT